MITLLTWMLCGILTGCSKGPSTPEEQSGEQTVTYQASNAIFANPERGFIHTFSTLSDNNSLNSARLSTLFDRHVSMILRIIYLQDFKDRPLDGAKLTAIESDLDKVRQAGLKTILRFAYTDDMSGTDAPIEIVEQHLDQLKPLFVANEDVIAFVQAGFIGAWGEWHSSSNGLTAPQNQQRVLNKLLEVLPTSLMVQLRTPAFKQQLFATTQPVTPEAAENRSPVARVGHHNDCFLSNATDYGTYSDGKIEAEKQYISQEALYVPTGGETCPPTDGFSPDCPESRNQMKLLKWTYLNLDWYEPTLNIWRASGCFEEFQRNLGYRLALESSVLPATVAAGNTLPVAINIRNSGYAPMYHEKEVMLVLKGPSGATHEITLPFDLRTCKPGQTVTYESDVALTGIPSGEYGLFMKISDRADRLKDRLHYAVRLANDQVWDAETGLNSLLRKVTID